MMSHMFRWDGFGSRCAKYGHKLHTGTPKRLSHQEWTLNVIFVQNFHFRNVFLWLRKRVVITPCQLFGEGGYFVSFRSHCFIVAFAVQSSHVPFKHQREVGALTVHRPLSLHTYPESFTTWLFWNYPALLSLPQLELPAFKPSLISNGQIFVQSLLIASPDHG